MQMRKVIGFDEDALVRMIYGADELLEALYYGSFQDRFRQALSGDPDARFQFLDNDYNILQGSIELVSGVMKLMSDGIRSGDLEIKATTERRW